MGAALFGRNTELSEAKAALSGALSGRGGLVLLSGDAGIGKSRLADELATEAAAGGAAVHWGRGWEGGGAPAYWPWIEALSSLAAGLDATHLGALVGEDAPEMVRLVPELRARLPHLEVASLPEADEGRFRLARAVGSTLGRAAAVRPVVVLLDDLHMADASTLSCLQLVARSAKNQRLLLVGTYREAEARLSPAVAEKIGALCRDAVNIQLASLDRAASLQVIQSFRSNLASDVASAIADAAGGNPLFLSEMSRLVAARGGQHVLGSELPLGVKESIRQRLSLLPSEAVRVLELASCAGREIDPPVLARSLGQDLGAVAGPLDRAEQAGMVVQRQAGRRAFSHDLVREVLYRGLDSSARQKMHQQLGTALQQLDRQGSDAASQVAHHLLEAAALDPEAAIRAAIDAAARALQLVAYEDAMALLSRALAVAEGGKVSPRAVAQLWVCLGEARIRAGQVGLAKEACARAVELARAMNDPALLATAALTWGSEFQPGSIDRDLVAWLREGKENLPEGQHALMARVMGRLAAALQPSYRPEEPVAMAQEAIDLARKTVDDRTLLEVIHSAMAAMMDYVHPQQRRPINLEAEALAQRFHDRPKELRARLRLFFDELVLGNVEMAEARASAFDALAKELRQTRFQWFIPSWHAARATYEGRWQDAEAMLDEAKRLTPPGVLGEMREYVQLRSLRAAQERHAEIVDETRVARSWSGMEIGPHVHRLFSASSLSRIGQRDEARRHYEELAASHTGQGRTAAETFADLFRSDPGNLAFMAEAFRVAPREVMQSAYTHLVPLRGLQASFGLIGMSWEGPIDRMLGVLATGVDEVDQAIEHYEVAIQSLERLGGRGLLARTCFEAAELYQKRNRGTDAAKAQRCVQVAKALATELGQVDLLTQFGARLDLDAARSSALPPQAPSVSLKREGDYWSVKGEGAAFRLKDTRGLQLLARLLDRPDQEIHCLELASEGPKQEIDGGDAGEWLDADARRQYQDRVEDLREELREAEDFGDSARAEKARAELEFIAQELSRGVGLGGRGRKAGSAAERARVAVQRRIKDAVTRIGEHDAALGRHLEWAVKTGTYCCYRPTR